MNGWKIAAIIFISLFILENTVFVFFMDRGFKDAKIEKELEAECFYEICSPEQRATYFGSGVCECTNPGIGYEVENHNLGGEIS